MINKLFSRNLIPSITIAAVFLSLIIIFDFVFDLFKVWIYSIQVFLVIYAIGIYKIQNYMVNILFLLVVPPILFGIENGAWVINGWQVFFEYFLVFYIFAFLYFSRFINTRFNKKNNKYIDYWIFIISFIFLLVVKYFLHSLASMFWWGKNNFNACLIYNGPWIATNSICVPIAIIVALPIFKLFDKYNDNEKLKW